MPNTRQIFYIKSLFKSLQLISNLFVDNDGDIWIIYSNGDVMHKGERVLTYPKRVMLSGLVQDNNTIYLIDSRGHVCAWNKKNKKFEKHTINFGLEGTNNEWTYVVSCITKNGNNIVAIDRGKSSGLFLLANGHCYPIPINDKAFLKIIADSKGGFYVVCWLNIWHFNENLQLQKQISSLPTPVQTFNTQFIRDVTIDWQGGLWIANNRHGLFYHHPKAVRIKHFALRELGNYDLRGMTFVDKQHIACFTYTTPYVFNTFTNELKSIKGIPSDEIFSIEVDDKGTWWIATRNGIFKRTKSNEVFSINTANVKALTSNRCIFAVPIDDNRLFCCFGSVNLGIIDTNSMTWHPIKKDKNIAGLYLDFFNHQWDRINRQVIISSKQATLQFDISTGKLYRLETNENDINSVDYNGTRWETKSNELLSTRYHKGKIAFVNRYSMQDVLGCGEFIDYCMLSQGDSIWVGSTSGLTLIVKKEDDANNKIPIQLISVELPDSEIFVGKDCDIINVKDQSITLENNQRVYNLNFSDCNYLYGAVGSNKLPEGWTLNILPPFYRSWWAFICYLIISFAIIFLVNKAYHSRQKLIVQLHEKRNKFIVQAQELKPEKVEITPQSKVLLDKAVCLVNQHLSDSDYGISGLYKDLGMSRSSLYRAIQQATGQTPVEFLRTIRLRSAETLLIESTLTLKEIAFKVGYNDARTFRKAFTDFYGITPQEYRKNGINSGTK